MAKTSDRRQDRKRAKDGNRRGGFFSKIVEPYRQIRLSLVILILNLLFGCLISAIVYYYVVDIHGAVSLYFQFTQEQAQENWNSFFMPLFSCFLLVLIFFTLTFFIIIHYTHQIYGPLVSIHAYLDKLLEGKVPKALSLRSSDQLTSLAYKINQLSLKIPPQTPAPNRTHAEDTDTGATPQPQERSNAQGSHSGTPSTSF